MKILFAGTPEIAVPSLKALAQKFDVRGVLTNPDRKKGRGKVLSPSPVKTAAMDLGLPVLQFPSLGSESRTAVKKLDADILAVFAYGRIFGPKFLSLFPYGGVNVHPSLLPKYRGCSPISSALLAGDDVTGITIQRIALEMDTGDIILQRTFPILDDDTAESMTKKFSREGASLLVDALELICCGKAEYTPQDESKASYCSSVNKEDGLIDWKMPAQQIERMVRAYYPWPKAYTLYREKKLSISFAESFHEEEYESYPPGTVIREMPGRGILIAASSGVLLVKKLQLESKREMDWRSFLNGNPGFIGETLINP